MKRILAGLAALAFAAFCCMAPAQAQTQPRTVKMATIALNNSPWHKALLRFKDVVEADSNGRYKVDVYTDGQLGDIAQLISAMQLGTIEFSYFGLSSLSFIKGGEALSVCYVPYLWKSAEDAEKIINTDPEFQGIFEKVATTAGVRVFGAWGQRSPRAIQSTRGPIMKPEDVKGLRLRIPAIPVLKAMFEKLGAQVTPMGMMEIYNALSRGTIDGQDNGFDLSIPPKYHEAAKYWSATDHVIELVGFFVSERFWKGLSAEDKAIFAKASKEAGLVTTKLTKELDAEAIDILKAAGATYVVPDVEAFRKAVAGVEEPLDGKSWPKGFPDRIRKLQEAP
ncbi:TRAP transporter substrate-binding protein [Bosea sp. BK604]|uniref:TRAP transporter substrate-binding protein n=1 Tax=Bosea sp. BK604 TaxID=2512180 RepID=UPI001049F05A|nr:TRAP transporter substrate-binding protein [Bosea sp. BK604]TCR64049.1 tripartite ATP-independent transporter DctP family solute receptor [Bosea sp. BK604]